MIYEVLILDNGVTTTVLKINYRELGGTHRLLRQPQAGDVTKHEKQSSLMYFTTLTVKKSSTSLSLPQNQTGTRGYITQP